MTIIEKIKAEIERRKSLLIQHSKLTYDLILETFIKEYDDLLSFLSTLEEPVSEELEEEIDRLWESFADEMEGPHNLFDIYARLARHFAEWGAEHLKK